MNIFLQLIQTIEPKQQSVKVIPSLLNDINNINETNCIQSQPQSAKSTLLIDELDKSFNAIIINLKHQYQINEILWMHSVRPKYSLYASLLTLLDSRYQLSSTYEEQTQLITNFIDLLLSKMVTDTKIAKIMTTLQPKSQDFVEAISNKLFQSELVVFYIALIFDLNIIVVTPIENLKHQITYYYADQQYDQCKPHIMLYCDLSHVYSPILVDHVSNVQSVNPQLLNYYDHPLIAQFDQDFNKHVVCLKNYIKPNKPYKSDLSTKLNKMTADELRELTKSKNLSITKPSLKTNKVIYKTKAELIESLEPLMVDEY